LNANGYLALGFAIGAVAFSVYVVAFPLQIMRRRVYLLHLEALREKFVLTVTREKLSSLDPDVRFVWSLLNLDLERIGESSLLGALKRIESLVHDEEGLLQVTSEGVSKELTKLRNRPELSSFVVEFLGICIGIASTFTVLTMFFFWLEGVRALKQTAKDLQELLRQEPPAQVKAT